MLARYLDEDEFFPDASLVVSFTLALSCPDGYSVATYRNQCKRVVSTEYGVSFESNMVVNLSIRCVPTFSITRSEEDSRYCIGNQMED